MEQIINNYNNIKRRKVNKYEIVIKKILIVICLLIVIILFFSNALGNEKQVEKKIVVFAGDTLWKIANEVSANNNDISIQEVIYDIKKLNNLKNSNIYEGQVLIVYEY